MTVRPRIKICGITAPEEAQLAAEFGVDALGLVFYPSSPRFVSVERAREVIDKLPPWLTVVGLFVDAAPEFIERVLAAVPLHVLQFHGSESRQHCEQWRRPYIKALKVDPQFDLQAAWRAWPGASGLLLDAPHKSLHGGTGALFEWSVLSPPLPPKTIVAGGLNVDNLRDCVRLLRPACIDICSGAEVHPGRKSAAKMEAIMEIVRTL